jgi:purine nucleoside permease
LAVRSLTSISGHCPAHVFPTPLMARLVFGSQVARVDPNRVMVLRAGSDFTFQPNNLTPAQYLALENNFQLSGFTEACSNVFAVGSTVVKQLSNNWNIYRDTIPSPGH